jgi:DNA mismatch repair protein MutS
MAGKSVVLRQTGLIVLLAQIGSFVPAARARVGVVDALYTRVGASDDLAAGESTFLVEMNETANILNNATERSLVLLDEVGRGTSTFDGLSIAWAVVEYLHDAPACRARTLFATHYHELTALADRLERVKSFRVQVREHAGRVVFLHRLVAGAADHSYGIEVARMAGLPASVVSRAREVLAHLEAHDVAGDFGVSSRGSRRGSSGGSQGNPSRSEPSPGFDEIVRRLDALEVDRMTPVEALIVLADLRRLASNA